MACRQVRFALVLTLVAAGAVGTVADAHAASPGQPVATDVAWRHDQLQQLHDSMRATAEAARGRALAARFRELYPDAGEPGMLRASDAASLHLRFDDAMLATFYRTDPDAMAAMQASLAELERRDAATPDELVRMRNALLVAKRFDEAASFGTSHPQAGFAPLPRFVDTGTVIPAEPSAWREAGDGHFERIALDLGPAQVLVMAGCHFSDDAAREIAADPVLGPVFRDHATWLGLPPGSEDPADIAEWNRIHPQAPMLAIHDRDEWPMFPQWIMPSFYVVRDGQVQGEERGWKADGARQALIAMLQEAGLLPAEGAPALEAPAAAP